MDALHIDYVARLLKKRRDQSKSGVRLHRNMLSGVIECLEAGAAGTARADEAERRLAALSTPDDAQRRAGYAKGIEAAAKVAREFRKSSSLTDDGKFLAGCIADEIAALTPPPAVEPSAPVGPRVEAGRQTPPYSYAMGDAASAYLKLRGGNDACLPGGFFWHELYDAMNAAAEPESRP